MATANNTIKTRVQLKSDTEANWNNASNFIPLNGEFIIYSADNTHPFCRLKVGDGQTTVTSLPFVDAGTINGSEVEIVKIANFNSRPSPGSPDKLYVDLSTNAIYHYDGTSGYTQLSNFTYTTTTTSVAHINSWTAGSATGINIENNTLKITNGSAPSLSYYNTVVVTGINKT